MKMLFCATALAVGIFTAPLLAGPFDGLYRPVGAEYADWSCNEEYLGFDGGAIGVVNGYLEGVENRCELTRPKQIGPDQIEYQAVCSGEGEEYSESVMLTKTEIGISVTRNGYTAQWQSCGASVASDMDRAWVSSYRMGWLEAGTRDNAGNEIFFACQDGYNGQLSIQLNGGPLPHGDVEFIVDTDVISMSMMPDGVTVRTDCRVCAENYKALWRAIAAGNRLTVNTSDARTAVFSLKGSKAALATEICEPQE